MTADIHADGQQLTVDTTRLTAVFRGADLIQLTNKSTGESYIRSPSSTSLLDLQLMQPTDGPLPPGNWSISSGKATASFSQGSRTAAATVSIDPATQEVVLKISGESKNPGVTGLLWGIAGVDLSAGRLVLPSQGGNYLDLGHLQNVTIQYPTSWAVQMAMFEAGQGGFLVYSTDTTFQWKDLVISAGGNSTANIQLKTEAPGPWPSATNVAAIEWRLNVFTGDWRAGGSVYKSWMQSQWPPVAPTAARSWIQKVQAVIAMDGMPDNNYLDSLALLLDPSKTILYFVNWRDDGASENFPDYTPAAALKGLVDHAHTLGFHVSLHVDTMGADPLNPDYQTVKQYQFKYPDTLALYGWLWTSPPSTPTRFAYIDPASSAWRKLLLSRIDVAIQAVHPDAIHLDSVPGILNDGNGLIEGMNSEQGLVQLHRDLAAAYPAIVFETEGVAEPSVPYCEMAQRWNGWYSYLPSHPISTFILTDNLFLYGHLNQPNPGEPGFLGWFRQYEAQGVMPLMHMDAVQRSTEPSFVRTFGQIHYFQKNDLRPDWTGDWKSALFRYRGSNGAVAVVTDSGTLITLQGGKGPIYQRAHGTTTIQTDSFIDGWPAFDATTLYGLDPSVEYWLDTLPRPSGVMHLDALPPTVVLGPNTRVDNSTASVSLRSLSVPGFDFLAGLAAASIGTDSGGEIGVPVATMLTQIAAGGEARQCIFEHPPGPGSESFVDFAIPLPVSSALIFEFAAGISDASSRTDPVTFRITVDGTEVWRRDVVKGSWLPGVVDLTSYAGRSVHLRLLTNVNAFHDSLAAWAAWSALALVDDSPASAISLDVTLAPNAQVASLAGSGQLLLAPGKATIKNAVVPGEFVLFLKPESPVAADQSLMNSPFALYYAEPGELPVAAYVGYNLNPSVGGGSSNGVTKSPVLILHPSNYGRTVASWTVQLPAGAPLLFSFSSGLQDGLPSPNGDTFEVAVNGRVVWRLHTSSFGWTDGSIDLSGFQGQDVFLELITNADDTGFYVGALWAGLQFTALTNQGSRIPAALVADSNGNVVFEPGEVAVIRPTWTNSSGAPQTFTGTASDLSGPAGPIYGIVESQANYGTVPANSTGSCSDCYSMFVIATTRPATHWDATFTETLSIGGASKAWTLHIGDSFADVPRTQPFYRKIETLLHNAITAGCTATAYCPGDPVARSQMAIFVAKGIAGGGLNVPTSGVVGSSPYNCTAGGTSLFWDVSPTDIFCKHVHYIAAQNVTLGCSPTQYCPNDTVTRLQMAAFIAKALVAPGGGSTVPVTYGPDPVTGLSYSCDIGSPSVHFTDVPATDPFCKHVHFLWAKGVIAGCGGTLYCPSQSVTRDAMAKFLVNAFNLQLYGP